MGKPPKAIPPRRTSQVWLLAQTAFRLAAMVAALLRASGKEGEDPHTEIVAVGNHVIQEQRADDHEPDVGKIGTDQCPSVRSLS